MESLKIFRVIGTDQQLARTLRQELEDRGIHDGKIALITEHDTFYGRAFPETLSAELPDYDNVIEQLIRSKCISCHGMSASTCKSSRRLDTYDTLCKVVQKGEPAKSQLFTTIGPPLDPHRVDSTEHTALKTFLATDPCVDLETYISSHGEVDALLRKNCARCHARHTLGPAARPVFDDCADIMRLVSLSRIFHKAAGEQPVLFNTLKPWEPCDCTKQAHVVTPEEYALLVRWVRDGAPERRLLSFRVLRGIDGQLPGKDADSELPSRDSGPPKSVQPGITASVPERRPEGRSQYDYLRRLRVSLKNRRDISAIGVVGSDVYDKLLVLRALKPHFPDKIFFTTDLHALYAHPEETPHTRNLIVASHFRLALDDKLQAQTPPFRDSYQTAYFLAARLAVYDFVTHHAGNGVEGDSYHATADDRLDRVWAHLDDSRAIEPLLHVVGNEEFERMTSFEDGSIAAIVHSPSPVSRTGLHVALGACLMVASVCLAAIWLNRDQLRMCLLLERDGGSGAADSRSHVWRWLFVVGLVGAVCVGIAIAAILVSTENVWRISTQGGTSTAKRSLVYISAGVLGAFSCWFLLGGFICALNSEPPKTMGDAVSSFRSGLSSYMTKGALLTCTALIAVATIVNGFSWEIAGSGLVILVILGFVLWRLTKDNMPRAFQDTFFLRSSRRNTMWWIIGTVAVSMFILGSAARLGGPPIGWNFVSNSRGEVVRNVDVIAAVFGFGAVGVLVGAFLFIHLSCRELYRAIEKEAEGRENSQLYWRRIMGGLTLVSKLTALPVSPAVAVMGILLMLVCASHPWVSPTPMPIGLLVCSTFLLVLFVASAFSVRWYFHHQRAQAVEELERGEHALGEAVVSREAQSMRIGWELEQMEKELSSRVEALSKETCSLREVGAVIELRRRIGRMEHRKQEIREKLRKKRKRKELAELRRKQIGELSEGVFQPLSKTPYGWILGGGTMVALADLWVRWLMISV